MTKMNPAEKIMQGLREAAAHARCEQLPRTKVHVGQTKALQKPEAKGTRGPCRTGVAPRRPRS
jgi:hypothetical protein